ncbi:MAG: hypothetical protein P8130_10170, partial [Deltaproteobacteria bacterium]
DPLPVANWPEVHMAINPAGLRQKIAHKGAAILPDEASRAQLDKYLAPIFVQYESERRGQPLGQPPDPRLVPCVLFIDKAEG